MNRRTSPLGLIARGVFVLASVLASAFPGGAQAPDSAAAPAAAPTLEERAQREGSVRVIAALRMPSGQARAEGLLPSLHARERQRTQIAATQTGLVGRLPARGSRVVRRFRTVPFLALEVDASALAALKRDPGVERVVEDRLVRPVLAESVPLIQADLAWDFGHDGAGQVVAVIDSGVDNTHPFLAGKVVSEACYATGGSCPNGQDTEVGTGAGAPCEFDPDACIHGTHVAGIAAGSGTSFSGVARGAQLISVQVFHASETDCIPFFENVPCARAFSSDIGAGLERIYELRTQYPIASVNLSLGGGAFTTNCDAEEPQFTAQINNLRSVGIPTVIAAGNDGRRRALAFPACISSAISVGATTKTDEIAWFSNMASFLSLLAPGEGIVSSIPGGDFEQLDGTSMAAPHVAGAWAIMKDANPNATVTATLNTLQQTGLPITDTRGANGVTKNRIRLANALNLQLPVPVLSSLSPSAVNAWGPGLNLTVNGTGFFHASVVRVNGVPRPTTYVGPTTLTAAVAASDLASTAAGITITVFNPTPGGGTSGSSTLTLRQPILTVSPTTVQAGAPVTVTLTNPPGGTQDWLAAVPVGASDTSYVQWAYVGAGAAPTWTVSLTSPGSYDFRLFLDGGYTRVAVSPPFTVNPGPPPVLSVSATTVAAGGQVTMTLTNGPGGAQDWISLAAVGSPDTSNIQWTSVGAGVTTRTWTVTLASPGSYEFRYYPNGGYARIATSPAVTVPSPALSVSATSVVAGGQVTVTLTNGLGGSLDWLALAASGSPDTSNVQWTYVGAGLTTRTWTITLASPGSYEFRLFLNGVYTRAATSPTVTATAVQGEPPALTVSASSIAPGGQVTVTLANGAGGAEDWLSVATVGSPDTSNVQWTYVGAGLTNRTWTVTLAQPGSYEFRLYLNGTHNRAATSPTVTVAGPTVSVSTTTVAVGGQVTVTLNNGLGGSLDWIALALVGSPDTSNVQWTSVGAGVTTRTWTVTLNQPGSYEFRLFLDGGYTKAATSPTVTVPSPPSGNPVLTVSSTTVPATGEVTVTLTGGAGGSQDWLALAVAGSPDTSYRQWTYVGAGVTTRTWTVVLPSPGAYEFRLFLNNGYTKAATSPTVTMTAPSLSVSTTTVPVGGGDVTVTLSNGAGGASDWLAVAPAGAADSNYLQWTYVGSGVTNRTWTVTLSAPGTYEFRLFVFRDNATNRWATSPLVTVGAPGGNAALAVSPSSVASGGQVTVTLTGGAGGSQDWLSLATVGSPDTSNVQWTYVGAGVTSRTWTVTLTPPGSYEFRYYLNGTHTRAATSPTVTVVPPTLGVSATTVTTGGQVTVTLANGLGGSLDWIALATAGSPDTSNVQWTYVGAGVTTRTWTVTLAQPGSYEFRLFLDGGYARAATSPTVSVSDASSNPASLTLSATTLVVGGQVTVTLANGAGGASDWIAFASATAPDTSNVQWTYVGAGVTTRTWTVSVETPGEYEFRLFLDGGYTRSATSPHVSVPAPSLSVSATSVPVGGSVTTTLGNGSGNAQDWLAFAQAGAPDSTYLEWTWVGAGVTTRTWTVSLPSAGGYEFRFFRFMPNGTYVRYATSPAVTAGP